MLTGFLCRAVGGVQSIGEGARLEERMCPPVSYLRLISGSMVVIKEGKECLGCVLGIGMVCKGLW